MILLDNTRKWRNSQRNIFNFSTSMHAIINNRTRDLGHIQRKIAFIQKMQDLIFSFQDVNDANEMMLYDYYCHYEIEILKEIDFESKCINSKL